MGRSLQHYLVFTALGLAVLLMVSFQRSDASLATSPSIDMLALASAPELCLTVVGTEVTTAPALALKTCRSTNNQRWLREPGASQWRTLLDYNYCLAVAGALRASASVTLLPCREPRSVTLRAENSLFTIVGSPYLLGVNAQGHVIVVDAAGGAAQRWYWFQAGG